MWSVLYYCTVETFLDTLFPTNLGLKRAENRTFRMKEYKFSNLSFQCFNKVKYNLQNLVVFHATGPWCSCGNWRNSGNLSIFLFFLPTVKKKIKRKNHPECVHKFPTKNTSSLVLTNKCPSWFEICTNMCYTKGNKIFWNNGEMVRALPLH